MAAPIFVGQRVLIEGEVRLLGVLTDPQVLRCLVRSPSGSVVQLVYPDEALTRRDAGLYEAAVVLDAPGTWSARWEAAGGVDAVNEVTFVVAGSTVTS